VTMHTRAEMLDLVVVDGRARGIVTRNLVTGAVESHVGDAVVLATGGYGNVFYLSTNAKASNATAIWRAHKRGAFFGNPCFTQIHPTCIPMSGEHQSKLTLMSESLRNDGRVWVPTKVGDTRPPDRIPIGERDYYLERKYPSFGNLSPRDIASRAAKEVCDEKRGVGPGGRGVYLDFADAIARLGEPAIREKYGNLFDMYERITGENAYRVPMRIYPAVHYTMGGLWVDYNLMSTIVGLFVAGEANFSDHGANRLGERARARAERGAQPVAREGRSGGRLPRAGRAHVHRRAPSHGIVRQPLPRGAPDPGRRGAARRRALRPRGGLGVHGPAGRAEPPPGALALRIRPPEPAKLPMNLTLRVWRQKSASARGRLVTYEAKNISPDMSFLEMLDVVNEELIDRGEPPIAFEHDCREGICGTCGFMINGVAHGPKRATTVCQLHMRSFRDGDRVTLEPWRARAFPVIKDLIVDRSAFDRIVQAGGFISAPTGSAPDANAILVRKEDADLAF